jgi:predicted PurR-regulated permease PerM
VYRLPAPGAHETAQQLGTPLARLQGFQPTIDPLTASLKEFALKVAIVVGALALVLLLWKLAEGLVLLFAATVFAVALRSLVRLLERFTPLRGFWALAVTSAVLLTVLAAFFALIGWRIADQVGPLAEAVTSASDQLREYLQASATGQAVLRLVMSVSDSASQSLGTGLRAASGTVGVLVDAVLIVFIGLFLAGNPTLYRRGALRLTPVPMRQHVANTLDALEVALRHWLGGVLVTMICVGTITWLGLWLLGIPLALSIGFLAGLTEFVPYLGPILSAIPAILVAFTHGTTAAVAVIGLYLLVHAIEAYVLVPLIQRRAVALPPALGLTAVLVFGILFGVPGVIFAHPLMVCAMILVERNTTPTANVNILQR